MIQNKSIEGLIKSCYWGFQSHRRIKSQRPCSSNPILVLSNELFSDMKPYSRIKKRYFHNHDKTFVDLRNIVSHRRDKQTKTKYKNKSKTKNMQQYYNQYHRNYDITNMKGSLKSYRKKHVFTLPSQSSRSRDSSSLGKSLIECRQSKFSNFSNQVTKKELSRNLDESIKAKMKLPLRLPIDGDRKIRRMNKVVNLIINQNQCNYNRRQISDTSLKNELNFLHRGWETEGDNEDLAMMVINI